MKNSITKVLCTLLLCSISMVSLLAVEYEELINNKIPESSPRDEIIRAKNEAHRLSHMKQIKEQTTNAIDRFVADNNSKTIPITERQVQSLRSTVTVFDNFIQQAMLKFVEIRDNAPKKDATESDKDVYAKQRKEALDKIFDLEEEKSSILNGRLNILATENYHAATTEQPTEQPTETQEYKKEKKLIAEELKRQQQARPEIKDVGTLGKISDFFSRKFAKAMDFFTSTPNRNYTNETITQAWNRNSSATKALEDIIIDINQHKPENDPKLSEAENTRRLFRWNEAPNIFKDNILKITNNMQKKFDQNPEHSKARIQEFIDFINREVLNNPIRNSRYTLKIDNNNDIEISTELIAQNPRI